MFGNTIIQYQVLSKGQTSGPFDFVDIERKTNKGEFTVDDCIRIKGSTKAWKPLRDVLQKQRRDESITFVFFALFCFFLGLLLLWTCITDPTLNGRHSISGTGVGLMLLYTGALFILAAVKNYEMPIGKLPSSVAKKRILFLLVSVIIGFVIATHLP